jgi:hypothetical protein
VTGITITNGQTVEAGQVLFSVALRPIVAAHGQVPSFRDLTEGDRGEDVAQLQRLLSDLGRFRGAVNGRFTPATTAAVRAWQKELGLPGDGIVRASDLVYFPSLPTRVLLDTNEIVPGRDLAPGSSIQQLGTEPVFTLVLPGDQANRIPIGTAVEIDAPGGQKWLAVVGNSALEADGSVRFELAAADGASICAKACDDIPMAGQTLLDADVVTDPEVEGLTVPVAALRTDAEGRVSVVDEIGAERRVLVVASVGGTAVVEGIGSGTKVRVPALPPG